MTPAYLAQITANLLCFLVVLVRRPSCRIVASQTVTAFLTVLLVLLYFSDACSKQAYENTVFCSGIACTALELFAIRGVSRWVSCVVATHQLGKVNWHWICLPFQLPDALSAPADMLLVVLNLAVMLVFALAYSERDATASEVLYVRIGTRQETVSQA